MLHKADHVGCIAEIKRLGEQEDGSIHAVALARQRGVPRPACERVSAAAQQSNLRAARVRAGRHSAPLQLPMTCVLAAVMPAVGGGAHLQASRPCSSEC